MPLYLLKKLGALPGLKGTFMDSISEDSDSVDPSDVSCGNTSPLPLSIHIENNALCFINDTDLGTSPPLTPVLDLDFPPSLSTLHLDLDPVTPSTSTDNNSHLIPVNDDDNVTPLPTPSPPLPLLNNSSISPENTSELFPYYPQNPFVSTYTYSTYPGDIPYNSYNISNISYTEFYEPSPHTDLLDENIPSLEYINDTLSIEDTPYNTHYNPQNPGTPSIPDTVEINTLSIEDTPYNSHCNPRNPGTPYIPDTVEVNTGTTLGELEFEDDFKDFDLRYVQGLEKKEESRIQRRREKEKEGLCICMIYEYRCT